MSITTKDKLAFALELGRHTKATMRQVQALMRYAQALKALETNQSTPVTNELKRRRIEKRIWDTLFGTGCQPIFDGPMLKIRVPSGEEIVCPA